MTCRSCGFYRPIESSKTGVGKCGCEPQEMTVNGDRAACRHYKNKYNHIDEDGPDNEILYEDGR